MGIAVILNPPRYRKFRTKSIDLETLKLKVPNGSSPFHWEIIGFSVALCAYSLFRCFSVSYTFAPTSVIAMAAAAGE